MSYTEEQQEHREALVSEGVFSVREAIAFLGISRPTLYREIEAGRLPFIKHGRRTLIPRRAAITLLAAGLRGGASAGA